MGTKTVKLNDFSKVLKEFNQLTLKQQQAGVASGLARSIPDLVAASPVDTGLYASSWDFTVDEKKAVLGNYSPHAPIIESGARPFTPPIGPLLAWAKRVLKSASQPPDYDSEVWALARGTQNKISEQGMKPRHVLENMIPKILENVREELKRVGQ